ncbi:MAG: phosphoribosylamine--glycine ligase [Candidatus Margulisbacteria bacterium]|nr:phosphoribosylamine--glycine ligase [Candidatus Margulisiibacteriota bacterium]
MKVLVIGSGGREHTIVWKLKQSPKIEKIYCAPGNAGIAEIAECLPIQADDIPALLNFAKENTIDLTVVGPEIPLVAGIADEFEATGLKVFGPSKKAAQLEGSKAFAKKIMKKYKVPTASYEVFKDLKKAKEHIFMSKFPVVIKADGLAAGKGVTVATSLVEATKALEDAMQNKVFGEAGATVVIEECLQGEEASILAFVDGKNFVSMVSSQDHKRIFDDDKGPNTGGMGTYSPAPLVTNMMMDEISNKILKPTIEGMAKEGAPYKGVLYAGLMLTKEGPKVIEYNCRFGDPETQVVLPRLESDLLEAMLACVDGTVDQLQLSWKQDAAVCVVLAADGYPGSYEKGKPIQGLENFKDLPDVVVFHAGTKLEEGVVKTSGGRVLGVTGLGSDIKAAIKKAYNAVNKIQFDGIYFRKDIGKKALKHLQTVKK